MNVLSVLLILCENVIILNNLFILVFEISFCIVFVVGRKVWMLDGLIVVSVLVMFVFNRKCV